MAINPVEVDSANLKAWGISVYDYTMDAVDSKGNFIYEKDAAGNIVYDEVVEGDVTISTPRKKQNRVDFQDLLIKVSEQRAATVEGQIEPMSVRMSTRNRKLDNLGAALSIVADIQAKFTDADDTGNKDSDAKLTAEAKAGLELVGYTGGTVNQTLTMNKSTAEYYQQMLKTKLDSLNNASSKDMTRLQSLVDKRDESYSTATSLMQSVADTRANTIKNM